MTRSRARTLNEETYTTFGGRRATERAVGTFESGVARRATSRDQLARPRVTNSPLFKSVAPLRLPSTLRELDLPNFRHASETCITSLATVSCLKTQIRITEFSERQRHEDLFPIGHYDLKYAIRGA